jgi:hypothetical protein
VTKFVLQLFTSLVLGGCTSFQNLPSEEQGAILCMRDVIAGVPGVLDAETAIMRTAKLWVSYPVIRYDLRPHPMQPGRGIVVIIGRDAKGNIEYRIPSRSAYQARHSRVLTDAVKNELATKCGAVESSMVWLDG